MAELMQGKIIAEEVLNRLKSEINSGRLNLCMAAVLVGDKPELKKFVELKKQAAQSIGAGFKSYFFPENISEDDLVIEVKKISKSSEFNGIFIELPLPKHIDSQKILSAIPINKDPDVLSPLAQESFFSGDFRVLPPAVEAIKVIFEKYRIDVKGKNVAVFGQGFLVGKPISFWLEKMGANVSAMNIDTENPGLISKNADIVISGVGRPGLVTGDMVKSGAIIVDFGYGKKGDKMVGDVDFESVVEKASLITPIPGGVGPILVATVLKNLMVLNKEKDI